MDEETLGTAKERCDKSARELCARARGDDVNDGDDDDGERHSHSHGEHERDADSMGRWIYMMKTYG